MSSDVLHAAHVSVGDAAGDAPTGDLLVLWQHPDTREIVPVGRFRQSATGYTFCYTRAAGAVEDFRPLPGLGTLRTGISSPTMPSIFRARVMDPERPDFRQYMCELGLDPDTATPWEQIVHSGGDRAGDTLQFMELPVVRDGRAHARFLTSGVRHIPDGPVLTAGGELCVSAEEQEAALGSLRPGDSVRLVAQERNAFDANATLVCLASTSGAPLGWVPQALTASVRELMDARPISARVVRVSGPLAPAHLRLVLDLDVPAPAGFRFDRAGSWTPLASL